MKNYAVWVTNDNEIAKKGVARPKVDPKSCLPELMPNLVIRYSYGIVLLFIYDNDFLGLR